MRRVVLVSVLCWMRKDILGIVLRDCSLSRGVTKKRSGRVRWPPDRAWTETVAKGATDERLAHIMPVILRNGEIDSLARHS
jgi:hypothetical protein